MPRLVFRVIGPIVAWSKIVFSSVLLQVGCHCKSRCGLYYRMWSKQY